MIEARTFYSLKPGDVLTFPDEGGRTYEVLRGSGGRRDCEKCELCWCAGGADGLLEPELCWALFNCTGQKVFFKEIKKGKKE